MMIAEAYSINSDSLEVWFEINGRLYKAETWADHSGSNPFRRLKITDLMDEPVSPI